MKEIFTVIIPYVLEGLPVTLAASALALAGGFVFGLLMALLRVYGGQVMRRILMLIGTVFRSVPQVVLLMLVYFVITGSINVSAFGASVFSLGLISSVYQMEIFRAALESIDHGQMMAARTLGMTKFQAIFKIVLPQALRRALPPWSNEVVSIIKSSPLVYQLGVPEMLRRGQYIIARTRQPFPTYISLAVLYFILIFTCNAVLRKIENKTRVPQ